jgi:hypothetical protein
VSPSALTVVIPLVPKSANATFSVLESDFVKVTTKPVKSKNFTFCICYFCCAVSIAISSYCYWGCTFFSPHLILSLISQVPTKSIVEIVPLLELGPLASNAPSPKVVTEMGMVTSVNLLSSNA